MAEKIGLAAGVVGLLLVAYGVWLACKSGKGSWDSEPVDSDIED